MFVQSLWKLTVDLGALLRIRRVKCDLTWPFCFKCRSTGRTCDGYGEKSFALETENKSSHPDNEEANRAGSHNSHQYPCTTIGAHRPRRWQTKYYGSVIQNLGPLLVLPVTGSVQTEAMFFFECISIKHLNEYHPCESWQKTLMFFSQTVPSVRYAAVALALIQRNYQDYRSSNQAHQLQSSGGWLPDKASLLYYNRAIQLLLDHKSSESTETTAITLLVCYLFTCFDHLAGNHVQALQHLRGGVELSRNIGAHDEVEPLGVRTLIRQVTQQIRRLDTQAATFLVDWIPINLQEAPASQIPSCGSAFRSPNEAADHLQVLVAWVVRLRMKQISPKSEMPPPSSSVVDTVFGQLETWSSLFENMLQQRSSCDMREGVYPLISLLRLQQTIAWILLSSHGPGREMEYDDFLPQFQQCMVLVADVAAAHERYSGSLKPTFTPEVGIIPVLYIIGIKCRSPGVRREVLRILRRQSIREAVWDSTLTARIVEWAIDIEEGGSGEANNGAQSAGQIAPWQRIETISWVINSEQSAARLDIEYTFCTQEGMYFESLVM